MENQENSLYEEIYQKSRSYLETYTQETGTPRDPRVREVFRKKVQQESAAGNTFYLLINIKDFRLDWSYNLQNTLGFDEDSLTLKEYYKAIHPHFLPFLYYSGVSAYEIARANPDVVLLEHEIVTLLAIFSPREKRYKLVAQHAQPLEVDSDFRIISHVNRHTIVGNYEECIKPQANFIDMPDWQKNLNSRLKEKLFDRVFSPVEKRIIKIYALEPNSTIPKVAESMGTTVHSITNQNKNIKRKAIKAIGPNFADVREVARYFRFLGWIESGEPAGG
jgi:hypothetical protein